MYKILILDESEVFCRSLAELLPDEFEPYLCHDGEQFAEQLQTIRPDFLVLDLMISGTDGLYVLEAANFPSLRRGVDDSYQSLHRAPSGTNAGKLLPQKAL